METKIDQVKYSDVTIVNYHYVREINNSSFKKIKGLELNLFIEQIKYFKKYYNIITIEELINSTENKVKLPSKALLLTFDDGYSDHFNNVFPILKKYKIQGSFYIPGKAVKEHKVLDVNKIHFILASKLSVKSIIEDIKMLLIRYKKQYNLKDFNFYYNKLATGARWDSPEIIFIKRLLQVELVEELRLIMVDFLFQKYVNLVEDDFAKSLYLDENQIKIMIKNGMHIGVHGYNHYWWNKLNLDDLEKEIDLSLEFLKSLGQDISNWTAAYPYGSYSKKVEKLLKKKKCSLAFTSENGIANNLFKNKLAMKRLDTNDFPTDQNALTNDWFNKSR